MIYFDLFITFFKIGAFTVGGGYAMLPLIRSEVIKNGWISADKILDFIAVSESTPGPFAVNIATYTGITVAGISGAFFATLGVVLPSFIIILTIASFFNKYSSNKYVTGIMSGLRPAVIGLIASAVLSVGKSVFFDTQSMISAFFSYEFYILFTIFLLSIILTFKKIHPIYIIILSAILGIFAGFYFHIPV